MNSSVEPLSPGARLSEAGDPMDQLAAMLARAMRARVDADPLAPIAVADLFHSVLPPRATAAQLGYADDMAAYGVVLMRLLSGERGYVLADPEFQRTLCIELEKPTPDAAACRGFARAQVALAPRALDLIDKASACRCCGGRLPRARTIRYCPSCGEDLGVQRCPACSTQCDIGWQFCVTCGRGLGTE